MSIVRFILVLNAALFVQPAIAQAPLKVGLVVPLSGVLKSAGNDVEYATRAWIGEKNAVGGLRGRKVELRVYNDESTGEGAQRAAAKAIEEGVDLFLNCFGTVACLQVAREAKAANLALLGPIAGAEVLRGPEFSNVISTRPAASSEMSVIFNYLAAIGRTTSTVIYQDDGFGIGYRDALARTIAAVPGIRIRNQFPIDLAKRNHEDVAASVVASGEDFSVILLSNTPNSIAMINALDKKGFRGINFNLAAQANAGFVAAVVDKVKAQSLMVSFVTTTPSPTSLAPAAVAYRNALEKWSSGATPAYVGFEAFVTASVLEHLTGGYTPERIESTLRRHPNGGLIGRIPMSYDTADRTLRGWRDIAVVSRSGKIRHD